MDIYNNSLKFVPLIQVIYEEKLLYRRCEMINVSDTKRGRGRPKNTLI